MRSLTISLAFLWIVTLSSVLPSLCKGDTGMSDVSISAPAATAYIEPNPDGAEISEEAGSITKWSDRKQRIVWYGRFARTGAVDVALRLKMTGSKSVSLKLSLENQSSLETVVKTGEGSQSISFGQFLISKPGYHRFVLEGVKKDGGFFGDVLSLELSGDAMSGAHFNTLRAQRGSPSVHLSYPTPPETKVAWFYNEVTGKTDPTASYYMACGWHRGYFGMQVNSPKERRVIFSVWDAGDEAKDRKKVDSENRVKLLAKGERVVTDSFGNEGTGGHSHLVYPWKTGETYRFLVSAEPKGDKTIYSGYFFFPEKNAWGLIARFQAPKDGSYLKGLYSFDEDFWGANGQHERLAEFGNQWIKTANGDWIELTKATFTHTGLDRKSGTLYRYDYDAGAVGDRFYLRGGGFKDGGVKYKDSVSRPANGNPPLIEGLPE